MVLGCDVGQMIVPRLAVRQARVRFPARLPMEVFPTELTSDEEMKRNLGDWRRMNVLYECDGMNVCSRKKVVCLYSHNNLPLWEA